MPEHAQHGTTRYFQISFIDRETYEAIDYSSFAYKIYIYIFSNTSKISVFKYMYRRLKQFSFMLLSLDEFPVPTGIERKITIAGGRSKV